MLLKMVFTGAHRCVTFVTTTKKTLRSAVCAI